MKLTINTKQLNDLVNLKAGLFFPLTQFVDESVMKSIINDYQVEEGQCWTIPITFSHPEITMKPPTKKIEIFHSEKKVCDLIVTEFYEIDLQWYCKNLFGTTDINHPGVYEETEKGPYRISGKIENFNDELYSNYVQPKQVKEQIKSRNLGTITGFQTRNPPHTAHEHLQRVALEVTDGLLISPLVGWKKIGDFSEGAINVGYAALLENYFPTQNVIYQPIMLNMYYAGPREAIFHALVRKNLGCTHFIIGRDHAGVGNFYEKYAAQELARTLQTQFDLGIELLLLSEPQFCPTCNQIASHKNCRHQERIPISGSVIRSLIVQSKMPPNFMMRDEVSCAILDMKMNAFI